MNAADEDSDPAFGSDAGTPTTPSKRRRSWFTPGKKPVQIELAVEPPSPESKPDPDEDVETLLLTHFTCPPKIDFGTMRPGGTATRHLRVKNPNDYEQQVLVDKFPTKKDFTISDSEIYVEAESEIYLTLTWNPIECGNYRELVLFKIDGAFRLQATLMGQVVEPPKPKKVRKTWAMKPKIAPHALKPSNKANVSRPAPSSKPNMALTQVKPTVTRKPEKKTKKASEAQVKAKSKVIPLYNPSEPPCPKSQESSHVLLNPQQPKSALPQEFTQQGMQTLGVVDSPSRQRRTTFEKTSPEMHNTPTISSPPEKVPHWFMQARRLMSERTPSPLGSVKENQPRLLFCDNENSPPPFVKKSKLRRSNTYTKVNESPDFSEITSPTDSTADSPLSSEQDTTVIDCTKQTETTEIIETVTTHITEEVIESEEMCEYLVKESPTSGVTYTQMNKSSKPIGRHLFSSQYTDCRAVQNVDMFDATRVINRVSDASYNDSRASLMSQPNFATFVKSPGKDLSILSETRTIYQGPGGPLSETYRVSNAHDDRHNLLSPTQKPVHRQSPRRFFSDLLAMHEEGEEKNPERAALNVRSECVRGPTPETCRISSLTVTKGPSPMTHHSGQADSKLKRELFDSPDRAVKPSPLTITKEQPALNCSQISSPVNPRRFSTLTVTKNRPTLTPPQKSGGSNIFGTVTPDKGVGLSDSLGAKPLPNTPSPGRRSPYNISPCGASPHTVKIQGTNFPGCRSPRQMPVEEHGWSPSPRKPTPSKEKTKRRTSGQFRRRSSPRKHQGSLVARGLLKNDDENVDGSREGMTDKTLSPVDAPMSLAELIPNKLPQENIVALAKGDTVKKEGVHHQIPQPKPIRKPMLKKPSTNLASLPNYLRPTSSTNRRKDAVADGKKLDYSGEQQSAAKKSKLGVGRQEPAPKRVKSDPAQSSSVLAGLTKTQLLRRKAALSDMEKGNKAAPKKTTKQKAKPTTLKPGVAQGKLKLIKATTKTALPKHPMAFAAKNVYYDERWKQKQERGFVRWLNFVLTPDEEECGEAMKPKKIDAGALCLNASIYRRPLTEDKLAPSRETLSFRLYSARRRLNRLRRHACKLFTSDTMVHFHKKLEVEVECQRLLVRPDRKIHADLGIKQKILDLLLSYNPLWLRIGLEAVYGEVLPLASNSDAIGLSRFILTRLLANPDIAAEFAHPSVPHLYREGYDKAVAQFTLKKFLLIVVFLDMAKTSRLIDHDPCLFCKDSEHKGSRDLLLVFSRDNLSGEGDLGKHISYMGYTVTHVQTPLDELDYAITNLATDLRDGTRLTRLIGLLSERWTLTNKLRVPAISRLQKVHNTNIAFSTMLEMGLDLSTVKGGKIDPRDIVDGHMEKTHHLLWQIIFNFQVEIVLDEKQLEEEIRYQRANLIVKDKMAAILRDDIEALGIPENRRESTGTDMYFKSPRLSLLLKWCRAVCAFYNVKVENFTVSFSDGRVLCYLIHHYHPSLLSAEDIQSETTQTVGAGAQNDSINSESGDDSFTNYWTNSFSPSTGKASMWDRLLANERENFHLVHERVRELGDIPDMIWASDMSNTIPDEKVVITYVTYLCARLLDIRQEARAARVIQVAWRRYRLKAQKCHLEKRYVAACTIQRAVREYLRKKQEERRLEAVVVLQAAYRGLAARRRAAKLRTIQMMSQIEKSVIKIQAMVRSWLVRRRMERQQLAATLIMEQQRLAAVLIQAWWRMVHEQQNFLRMKTAVSIIEEYYQSIQLGRAERACYLQKRAAALTIQNRWRAYTSQRDYRQLLAACLLIQRTYRAVLCARQQASQYRVLKEAVVTLQASWRGYRERKRCRQVREAALTIQTYFRRFHSQRESEKRRRAIVHIQQWYRACRLGQRERVEFYVQLGALITIQAFYRGWRDRRWLCGMQRLQKATLTIQAHIRGYLTRRKFSEQKRAALIIQKRFRARSLAKKQFCSYHIKRGACLIIQSHFRAWIHQRKYRRMRSAAVTIQKYYKGFAQRSAYMKKVQAVRTIQQYYRAKSEGERQRLVYTRRRSAVVAIQRRFRSYQVRRDYLRRREKVVRLQAVFRGYLIRKQWTAQNEAASKIQSALRAYITKQKYLRMKAAVILIQTRFKSHLIGMHEREHFLKQKMAAICIQSWLRGILVRHQLQRQQQAAIILQSAIRSYNARWKYLQLKQAATVLQRAYRCRLLMKQERRKFLIHKGAALTIQSAVKSYFVRKDLRRRRHAATLIQASFRRYVVRKRFLNQVKATLVIQKYLRALLSMRRDHLSFLIQKGAALTIQSTFRLYRVRKEEARRCFCATVIQAGYRAHRARSAYLEKRAAACVIQNFYRSLLLTRQEHRAFLTYKKAAVTLQAAVRSYFVRKVMSKKRRAATLIQTVFRQYMARREYLKKREAVCLLQKAFKRSMIQKEDRRNFLHKRGAVIVLQAALRSYLVRKELDRQQDAATLIQATFKQFISRKKFIQKKRASCVIQKWYRNRILQKQARATFLNQKHSAVKIQSVFRSYLVRKELARQCQASVLIQSIYRQYSCRKYYQRKRKAISTIQTWFRSIMLKKVAQRDFIVKKEACVLIQSAVRSYFVRKEIDHKRKAATKIQSLFRAYTARKAYLVKKTAACVIQIYYRAFLLQKCQRRQFLIVKGAAITIQAVFRGYTTRKVLIDRQRAAVAIQSLYRRYQARQSFILSKTAVVCIQKYFRAHLLRQSQRQEFLVKKGAAIHIQAAIRGHITRRRIQHERRAATKIQCAFRRYEARKHLTKLKTEANHVAVQKRAATTIQTSFRCFLARRQYKQIHTAVVTLQSHVRALLLCRHQRQQFLRQKQAAIVIQSAWKSYIVRLEIREENAAATAIQAFFRGYQAKTRYMKLRHAASVIQSHFRAHIMSKQVRRSYLIQKGAAITIQSFVRSYFTRKDMEERHLAATSIQATWKCYVAQRRYQLIRTATLTIQRHVRALHHCRQQQLLFHTLKQSAIIIQSAWRGYICRHEIGEQNVAATAIQSLFKAFILRKRFVKQKQATSVIQSHVRAYLLGKSERRYFLLQKGAAMTVQAFLRSYIVRRDIQVRHQAATSIQAMYLCYKTRRSYLHKLRSVRTIQRWFRARRVGQCQREVFLHKKRSVCKLQAAVRKFIVKKRVQREKTAAVKIQSVFRAYILRRRYTHRKQAAVVIQKFWRHRLVRRQEAVTLIQRYYRVYREKKLEKVRVERRRIILQKAVIVTRRYLSVIKIQRCFRRHLSLKKARAQVQSIIKIQRWVRCRLAHLRFRRMMRSIVVVQRAARAYLARRHERLIKAQAVVRGWLTRRRIQRTNSGITKFQALWRAYRVRKLVLSGKVRKARRRVEAASAAVTEEKKLGNITTSALDFLLRYTQISVILEALMKLDVATRWSSTCCELMAASNATHVIFTLIRSCNRSLPHIEVIKYSINVLLNLTKYAKTSSCVFDQEDSIDTLVNLLSIFRDKGPVFTKTCTLLGLLCHPPHRREKVLKMPKIVGKIQSIHKLVARKYAMEEKRNLVKAKMAASKSLSCSFLSTTINSRHHVPRIEPEWVLRRESLHEINHPLHSTKFLLNCLQVDPK